MIQREVIIGLSLVLENGKNDFKMNDRAKKCKKE